MLVGVIFYAAQQLKKGVFDRQDIPSMNGEIVIAPVVTCVIFFLFASDGANSIAASIASMGIYLLMATILAFRPRGLFPA